MLAFHRKDFLPGPWGLIDLWLWLLLTSCVILSKLLSVVQSLTFFPPVKEITISKLIMRLKLDRFLA